MSTSFEREILNPALATASTLSDASIVLNDFVLHNKQNSWSLNYTIKYYVNLRPGSIRYNTLVVHNREKLMVSWCRLQEHFEPKYKKEACDWNLISNTNTIKKYSFVLKIRCFNQENCKKKQANSVTLSSAVIRNSTSSGTTIIWAPCSPWIAKATKSKF